MPRHLDGTYAPPHTAAHPVVHAFNAFGRGPSDRRRVSVSWLASQAKVSLDVGPTVHAHEVDMAGGERADVDLGKVAIGKAKLVRGRLARASRVMGGKPRADGEGVSPILVTERADKPGHYVVVQDHGEHRVAALKLNGHSSPVPVKIVKRKGDAKKIMTTVDAGAGAEFAPSGVVAGALPNADRRKAIMARRLGRRKGLLKDAPAGDAAKPEAPTPIEAKVTPEIQRRINALASAIEGLSDASVARLKSAMRLLSREQRRAKRMRAVPGPYKRVIEAAGSAVEAAMKARGLAFGDVNVALGKYDPDQPRDDAGRFGSGGGTAHAPKSPGGLRGRLKGLAGRAAGAVKRFARAGKLQAQDTAHALRVGVRALKGESISSEDRARAVTALKDAGKALVSAGIFVAPGGGLALAVIEKAANKLGGSVLPSRFRSAKSADALAKAPMLPSLAGISDDDLVAVIEAVLAAIESASKPASKRSQEEETMPTMEQIREAVREEMRLEKGGFPLAPRDTAWDSSAAVKRWREHTGATEAPNADYAKGFLSVTGKGENFGDFSYPFVDVIDGKAVAVPKALFAARAAASGGRGASPNKAVADKVAAYQGALDRQAKEAETKKAEGMGDGDAQDCMDACNECADACDACAEGQTADSCEAAAGACRDCADACRECDMPECAACAKACYACATSCDKGPSADCVSACRACAKACRACAKACEDAMGSMSDEEMGKRVDDLLRKYGTSEGSMLGHANQGHNVGGGAKTPQEHREAVGKAIGEAKNDLGAMRTLAGMKNPPEESMRAHVERAADSASIAAAGALSAVIAMKDDESGYKESAKREIGKHTAAVSKAVDALRATKDNGERVAAANKIQSSLNRLKDRLVLIKTVGDAILGAGNDEEGEVEAESPDLGPELYEIRDSVGDAIRAKYGVGYYVQGVYPDSGMMIFRYSPPYNPGQPYDPSMERTFQAPFDLGTDGKYVVGDCTEVERKVSWEPVVKNADGTLTYNAKRIGDGLFELIAPHGEESILAASLAKSDLFDEVEEIENVGVRVRLAPELMAKHARADVLQVGGPFRVEEVERVEYAVEPVATAEALAKGKERGVVYLKVYGPMEKDTQGEHADAEDIYDAAVMWAERGFKLNLMHKGKPIADKVVFSDVTRVDGDLGLKKGTWFIAVKPTKENLARFKNGELTGASMEGSKVIVGTEEIAVG